MNSLSQLAAWSAPAVNLAEHADNPIHTDAGAQAAGFPSALVAGVTVYAYLTHVPAAAWGLDWLTSGGAHVRFRSPVFDHDIVDYVPTDGGVVEAKVDGQTRAECAVAPIGTMPQHCAMPKHCSPTDGASHNEPLRPIEFVADQSWATYATRAGDDLAIYHDEQILHPVTWMRIANQFFHEQVVTGPWIHVRSHLLHQGVAPLGAAITATASVVDRFDSRAGERAILDVRISADGRPVAVYEHEAIVALADDVGG